MIIESLELKNFGPFLHYKIKFPQGHHSCVLLTGKNNEGKSNIIFAIRLVALATQTIGKPKFRVLVNGDEFFKLPQQDINDINIGRTLHNYAGGMAEVIARFSSGLKIIVYMDETENLIYAEHLGRISPFVREIFGFIPPLGPLAEAEEFLTTKHIQASINTSLAPRHLRNHLKQILSVDEYNSVQRLINESWQSIKLLECTHDLNTNILQCFFKEKTIDREIAWAGQGLQVWFQIITHLVRLRECSMLIFDEPEINLHPEKQNDLINILNEFYLGDVIIATHSVELMNNVNVSHILHIQKATASPKIKLAKDKISLDLVRSKIGSNFNLIASQFEHCDMLLFTEDTFDFKLVDTFLEMMGRKIRMFNIPLHGFSEYNKAIYYKDAYRLLIGKDVPSVVLLDKDYYPLDYLQKVKAYLEKHKIKTVFQYPIRCKYGYIIDFTIPEQKIIIECDGEHWHKKGNTHDRNRDGYLKNLGWKVLRFRGNEIKNNIDDCIERIKNALC